MIHPSYDSAEAYIRFSCLIEFQQKMRQRKRKLGQLLNAYYHYIPPMTKQHLMWRRVSRNSKCQPLSTCRKYYLLSFV